MNTVVIEHVRVSELPVAWLARLAPSLNGGLSEVTVRIDEGVTPDAPNPAAAFADDPLFGMWADRKDMADVDAYIRQIRAWLDTAHGELEALCACGAVASAGVCALRCWIDCLYAESGRSPWIDCSDSYGMRSKWSQWMWRCKT